MAPASFAINSQLQITGEPRALATGVADTSPAPHAVVFFESSVTDYQVLRQGLSAGTDAVLLDSGGDGLREMAAFLASRHNLTSIGVVAHGAPGAVALGTATLDVQSLSRYARELAAVGSALDRAGELDLWSCDVAAGQGGASLVQDLAVATGAGVAAADHAIGSAAEGGNWQLAIRLAGARGEVPFSAAALGAFHELLGTWNAAASMATARQNATATLLGNGKVLVAGGVNTTSGILSSAELYDPVTNTWSAAGSMAGARQNATATLLGNGKVLVMGGVGINGVLSSAELYNPVSNTWSSAGSMATPRYFHTATLLGNGKVLVAGGSGVPNELSSAELYDPLTNSWSAANSMAAARGGATATLLGNGKVLVAGGYTNFDSLSSAELYDPISNTWSAAASMAAVRARATATLLANGKVLVAGGFNNPSDTLSSAELYDQVTNTWSTAAPMATPRHYHTATLLGNGQVLVTGGDNPSGQAQSSAELYDPVSNTWSSAGSMATARDHQTATLLGNGKLLVAGGYDGTNTLSSAELYDPGLAKPSGTWSPAASMATARYRDTATLLGNGKVLVTGGDQSVGNLSSAELYDPVNNSWSTAGSMATARDLHTATLLGSGQVLVTGGEGANGALASAELYNPVTNTWSAAGSMAAARFYHTATLLGNGQVLVTGGDGANGGVLASAELYNPVTNTWSAAGSMGTARGGQTATLLNNGKVLVTGGSSTNGTTFSSAEIYDPVTNTWSAAASMAAARDSHTATLLKSGKLLVTGGIFNGITTLASAELYDPASNTWSAAGSLATGRYNHTATLFASGKVLVTGGIGATGALASAELYDPISNTWSTAGAMAAERKFQTATLLSNGQVLVTGGLSKNNTPLSSAELYTPDPANSSATWSPAASMATARISGGTLLGNGKVLVEGGYNGSFLSSAELYDPTANTWSAAGTMAAARYTNTTTLLGNGKVIVTGGGDNVGAMSSAELYDPISNAWSDAGSMASARRFQTATLLNNGKVLITGGGDNTTNAFSSAELYDPIANTWSAAASMATPRASQTATLLGNGKVLVVGGEDAGTNVLASAELYDPVTDSWSDAGAIATAREFHTATLLSTGEVLVAGGDDKGTALASAELYDPINNTWSVTAPMSAARESQTATVVGNGQVLVAGGSSNSVALSSAELYDPISKTWFAAVSLGTARYQQTATLLGNGQVLVAGGQGNSGFPANAELYNPGIWNPPGAWKSAASMATARSLPTETRLGNGKVLVTGGVGNSGGASVALSSAELYDPVSNTWSSAGSMVTPRYLDTATLLGNGKVLVVGGYQDLSSAELYDPISNTWTTVRSMGRSRELHTATLLSNGKVLVAGGRGLGATTAQLYDPISNAWSDAGLMATSRDSHTATLLHNGQVLVAGGEDVSGHVLSSAELYDPASNTWSSVGSTASARELHTATLLTNGNVLVTGGYGGSRFLSSAELYEPGTRVWSSAGSMAAARSRHTATLLGDGKVLIAGGDDNSSVFSSAELYDPVGNTWASAGAMATARTQSNATSLGNGMVLVTAGTTTTAGGPFTLSSAELYNPAGVTPTGGPSVWIGGDAANPTSWSDANNWQNQAVPTSGSVVRFDTTAGKIGSYTSANDIPNLTLNSIIINDADTANAFTISGLPVSLTLGITSSSAAPAATIGLTTIHLAAANTWTNSLGTLNVTADVDLAGFALTETGAGDCAVSGTISSLVVAANRLIKTGVGTLTLSGANTYSGGTTDTAGAIDVTNVQALGAGAVTMSGGALSLQAGQAAGTQVYANNVVVTANSDIDVINAVATMGTLTIGDSTLTVIGSGPSLSSGPSLTFGDTTLTGNPTFFPGPNFGQTLNLGTIIKSGTATTLTVSGPGVVNLPNVPSGITLAGTGKIGKPVSIAGGAAVNPGNGPGTTGTLSDFSDILFASGATDDVDLGGTAAGAFDQIVSGGTVNLNSDAGTGATLKVSLVNGFVPVKGQTFTIIQYNGSSATTGTFAGLPEGAVFTAAGTNFTITYKGGSSHLDVVLTVNAGALSKFVVSSLSGNTLTAGGAFIVTVQGADALGNPVTSYSGPANITIGTSPTDPIGTFPSTVHLNSSGFGYFLATFKTKGTYTITATDAPDSIIGASAPITVAPANAVYFTVTAPVPPNAITGTPINVTVTAFDPFGNLATGYAGKVHLTSSDANATRPADATLTAGIGTFAITLNTAGSQTITASDAVSSSPITISGTSAAITAAGLKVTALTNTPTGFTATLNKALNPADLTIYGTGGTVQDVLLVGKNSNGNQPYPGTLIVDPSNKLVTFNVSSNYLVASSPGGSAALPDDTYTVTLASGSGTNGFQDVAGQGFDDGHGGHADYVGTFTTSFQKDKTQVLGIADFARGPNASGDTSTLVKVPNDPSNGGHVGIPITFYNAVNLTSAGFTLTYNANILTVTGGISDPSNASATFQMTSNVMSADGVHAVAVFAFTRATPQSGTQILGDITAYVPYSARSQYQVKDLLALGAISVNGGATVVPAGAVDVNAYFGDVNGDHHLDGLDKGLIANVASTVSTGFSAFTLLDPAIIGDLSGDNAVTGNSTSLLSNYLLALPVAKIPALPKPAIADNLFTSPFGFDPTLSLPAAVQASSNGVVNVPVLLDHPCPEGSTGLVEAELALTYDPRVLNIAASDITLGSIPSQGAGWQLNAVVDAVTGQISIQLFSQTPITTDQAGSLVNIAFHLKASGGLADATTIHLVDSKTVLADAQAAMILTPGLNWTAVLANAWVQALI